MHKAEISIFEKKYPILDFELILEKESDPTGLPTSNPYGGKMTITFASSRDDTDLLEAAMASRMMVKGIVRMFRRDGIQKLFDYEFANAYILFFQEKFDATSKNPVTTKIIIAPGILKRGDWFMENYWNPSNPFLMAATPISSSDDEEEATSFDEQIKAVDNNGNFIVDLAYCIEYEGEIINHGRTDSDGLTERLEMKESKNDYSFYWGDEALLRTENV